MHTHASGPYVISVVSMSYKSLIPDFDLFQHIGS